VRFFSTTAAAEAAGYRPCRRCTPTAPADTAAPSPVRRAAAYLTSHPDEAVSLEQLARIARLSPSHLQRQFTRALGVSPREFHAALRADRFRRELRRGRDVTAAIYEAGYGSPSRVYENAPTGRGVTPSAYRARGAGLAIGYTTVASPFGRLLVAATAAGVCAVKLGDSDTALEHDLRDEFKAATITRDQIVDRRWVTAVLDRITGLTAPAEVPLAVHGTAFQWRVWRALQEIPFGETRSYSEVARAIGRPHAVRAVARACATNPACLVIPCHRVVPKNGADGGYRWGVRRKARLLAFEAAAAAGGSGKAK
jgi:AraC family transcriptional regulator of adaptative response/methylated-DNA-[protein]-cysteine methyltransferase